MDEYEALVDSVNQMELTPEQKEAILSKAKPLNVELGKRGSDLMKFRTENQELQKKTMSYKSFAESMAKYNLSEQDLESLAQKAGVEKTLQDTIDELSSITNKTKAEKAELEKKLQLIEREKQLVPAIEEGVKNFEYEGKKISLLPAFEKLVKEELVKGIKDGDNEVIVQDKLNKALIKAYTDQEKFKQENGLVSTNTPIHRVSESSTTRSASTDGINPQELQEQLRNGGGTLDAAAAVIARIRAGQK